MVSLKINFSNKKGMVIAMTEKFGLQLYSLRDETAKDFRATVEKVGSMGYDYVEFAGYGGLSAQEMKTLLDNNNLKTLGAHISADRLINNLDEEIAFHKHLGNKYLICPGYGMESADDVYKAAKIFNEISKKCVAQDMILGYHNHASEFKKDENGKYFLDILMENTDIVFEIDVYWVAYAGVDVLDYINKHADRIELLHLKEMAADKSNVEVGTGILDFKTIIATAKANGCKGFIVEQEHYTVDPIDSVKICIDNLKKM